MAVLQHVRQLQVAQITHRGIADIGPQRTAGIGVFEKISHRIADPHLVPDPDPHRRAFLRIDRLAAQIFLVQAQIDLPHVAEHVHEKGPPAQGRRKRKVESRLVQNQSDLAEKDVNQALPLLHNDVETEKAKDAQDRRHDDEAADEDHERRD